MSERTRVRRDRKQWQRLVERYESSGKSQAEFCRVEGLNENTFRLWRSRVRASSVNGSAPFTEVVPAPSPESGWSMELDLPGGTKLRLRG